MYASVHAVGIYLSNEKTADFIPLTIDQFLRSKSGEKITEITSVIEKYGDVVFEQKEIADLFKVPHQFPNPAGEYVRGHAFELAETHDIDLKQRQRDISLLLTKERVRKSSEKKDKLIVESVRALDEIDQVLNLLCERLREWYSYSNPELDRKITDNYAYAKKVHQGTSDTDSMGAVLDPRDDGTIREFANHILNLFEERKILEAYITEETQKIAPNLNSLVGAVLTARLMSSVGGLEELARLPSSTIQVLGAEKALFRHLRTGARPPKHGLILQHPLVNRAPKKLRGKISRSLAAKIAILARVDCYSSEFVAEEVEAKLQQRVTRLKGEPK